MTAQQTTFTSTISSQDGWAQGSGASYPPSFSSVGTAEDRIYVQRYFDGGASLYYVTVGLMRFLTSSLPDTARVTRAVLRVNVITIADLDGDRELQAEWYDHLFIDAGDYTSTAANDAHTGTDLGALVVGDNDLELRNLGAISKTAFTGLRLHISGGIPTNGNWAEIASFDHPTLAEPRLIVYYEDPVLAEDYVRLPLDSTGQRMRVLEIERRDAAGDAVTLVQEVVVPVADDGATLARGRRLIVAEGDVLGELDLMVEGLGHLLDVTAQVGRPKGYDEATPWLVEVGGRR